MSSSNYKVQADDLSIGGGLGTSASYTADGELGGLATGEDGSSTNYKVCAGLECFRNAQYITFSVGEGTLSPGTAGAGVALGVLTTGAVTTSDGSGVNSVFLTLTSSASGGAVVSIKSQNAGLKRGATNDTVASATTTLTAGVAGYGTCVFLVTQAEDSPTVLAKIAPYNSTCTKTTGHSVGVVDTSQRNIVSATGVVKSGVVEVLVKTAISPTTPAGNDYVDVLTFVAAGTF